MKTSVTALCLCGLIAASILSLSPAELVAQRPQSREPFKIFDNLYYVGIDTVSAYLVTTSDGLIMIDTTYADSAEMVLENVRTLGLDPANIESSTCSSHTATETTRPARRESRKSRARASG